MNVALIYKEKKKKKEMLFVIIKQIELYCRFETSIYYYDLFEPLNHSFMIVIEIDFLSSLKARLPINYKNDFFSLSFYFQCWQLIIIIARILRLKCFTIGYMEASRSDRSSEAEREKDKTMFLLFRQISNLCFFLSLASSSINILSTCLKCARNN